ncbi:ATP-binding protein [Nocardioides caldifontis]|uniref:ATP-binding protein n=1 Tax=Nocardioides caldifontis TaxID=2588938 RepID=UPI001939C082|nr:helix-turn-helix transcriptional regulator [Nocardioides caldifontis]
MAILGREQEQAALDALVARARQGEGGALVVRGEAGLGKSALLTDVVERARSAGDLQVVRTQGVESEAPLAFAALQRLLRPVLGLADHVPPPQADALRVALGEAVGDGADRFLVFLGTLNLLADAAQETPVLAVVDDAHWLDDASAAALLFVARRLQQERVAVVFAAREGAERTFESGDLPELRLRGLDRAGVARLLAERAGAAVSPEVAAELLARTGGNPLALVELPDVLSADQLGGRAPLPKQVPVTEGVERVFLERARRLGADAQRLLLVAAADDSGRLTTVQRAAAALGVASAALDDVERSGLVRVTEGALELRHPLVRSAVYGAATTGERRAAHRALASVLGADEEDRRVWHRAAGADEPDPEVVADLDRAAQRAHHRGGHEAAAAAFERAAELTTDPEGRSARLYAAARCSWLTGQPGRARLLAEAAAPGATDPLLRADVALLRARIEWNTGSIQVGHRMVLQAAHDVAEHDESRAREMAMFATALASFGGDSGVDVDPLQLVGSPPADAPRRDRALAALAVGLDHVSHDRWQQAADVLRPLLRTAEVVDEDDQDLMPNLALAAWHVGDDEAAARLHGRLLGRARDTGAMVMVLYALTRLALTDLATGAWGRAEARATEALSLAEETGQPVLITAPRAILLVLAAHRGGEQYDALLQQVEAGLAQQAAGTLDVMTRDVVRWAKAVRELDRPAAAFHQAGGMANDVARRMAAVDRLETAVRAEQPEAARLWVDDLTAFAAATGRSWAAAAAAHGRALLAPAEEADAHFAAALEHHEGSPRAFDRARTRLAYGEHLRRRRRRVDAREHLRAALATFEDLGATPWAERAATELRASGETARKRDDTEAPRLTPQELQVATLVAQGLSNREVAAQLFLSPRTIDFHLRNVFAKTGVTSRVELTRLPLG